MNMKKLLDENQCRERNTFLEERLPQLRAYVFKTSGEAIKPPELAANADLVGKNVVLEADYAHLAEKIVAFAGVSAGEANHVETMIARNQVLQGKVEELTAAVAERDAKLNALKDVEAQITRRAAEKVVELGINPHAVKKPQASKSTDGLEAGGTPGKVNLTTLCQEFRQTNAVPKLQKM